MEKFRNICIEHYQDYIEHHQDINGLTLISLYATHDVESVEYKGDNVIIKLYNGDNRTIKTNEIVLT